MIASFEVTRKGSTVGSNDERTISSEAAESPKYQPRTRRKKIDHERRTGRAKSNQKDQKSVASEDRTINMEVAVMEGEDAREPKKNEVANQRKRPWSVINLGIRDQYTAALSQLGFEFEVLAEQEGDATLGYGGLARLSACQMDSLATLDYPAWGYGLRCQYGLFRQIILNGFQHEQPDYWLDFGNPWEMERVHVSYAVKFYGTVEGKILNGEKCNVWVPREMVEAVAYDNPIPVYGTRNTINLRLWPAKPSGQYNMVILTRIQLYIHFKHECVVIMRSN
ncbi:glycogen phosphorylase [Sarracenia purpurea var. burkii]